jgi:hypothetical protein
MALKSTALCLFAVAISVAPSEAQQSCDSYATLEQLPDRFAEIASALLEGDAEVFIMTDGACTCSNDPAVDRHFGKPAPQDINWSCRNATPDEQKY